MSSISFNEIYTKAIALFDDPKITVAYNTNSIQFKKLMYTFLQNAIALFTNPVSIGTSLAKYAPPFGKMEIFTSDGSTTEFSIDPTIILSEEPEYSYAFVEDGKYVQGVIDFQNRTVTFPDIISAGKEYALEMYYEGEFLDELGYNGIGSTLVLEEVKGILARLLIKAWAEEERNFLLDIRNLMQDTDFKITGNDRVLKSKNAWVDQLDNEVLQLQTKLAWNIRFMRGSQKIDRG